MNEISEYQPAYFEGVHRCMLELQAHERRLEELHREPEAMAREYLAHLESECRSKDGKWFVALDGEQIVGFICVWCREQLDEYMSEPLECAYISDLVVLAEHRRRGIGPALVEYAENYAKERGISLIKIGSLARNNLSMDLYRRLGYRDYAVQFVKKLA